VRILWQWNDLSYTLGPPKMEKKTPGTSKPAKQNDPMAFLTVNQNSARVEPVLGAAHSNIKTKNGARTRCLGVSVPLLGRAGSTKPDPGYRGAWQLDSAPRTPSKRPFRSQTVGKQYPAKRPSVVPVGTRGHTQLRGIPIPRISRPVGMEI